MNPSGCPEGGPFYSVFLTQPGWIAVSGSEAGLRLLILPRPAAEEALSLIMAASPGAVHDDPRYAGLARRITSYLSGREEDFSGETVDFGSIPSFRKAVLNATRSIPRGETRTYTWVATQTGRPTAARAAGQALGANPVPIIIPCHRVVAARGLGGFGGGLTLKRMLLDIETPNRA